MNGPVDSLFSAATRSDIEALLPAYIAPRRWFRAKTRRIASASIVRVVPFADAPEAVALTVVRVGYDEGPSDDYALVLACVRDDAAATSMKPHLVVGRVRGEGNQPMWLVDGLARPAALEVLMAFIARGASSRAWSVDDRDGWSLLTRRFAPVDGIGRAQPVETEQSNTSVVFGNKSILKVIRHLDDGRSPELEMSEHLTSLGFQSTPRLLAAVELMGGGEEPMTVAVVHAFVPNEGDAWTFALRTLRDGAPPQTAFVRSIAKRVAAMHAVLAAPTADPHFAVELLTRREREELAEAVEASLSAALAKAEANAAALAPALRSRLEEALRSRRAYRKIARSLLEVDPCCKTRVHGDLHLGQLLVCDEDFVVIDFEGEPARSLDERKRKRSPMVDVAGMLRSLHYASVTAGVAPGWFDEAKAAFLDTYYGSGEGAPSALPGRPSDRRALLQFFSLEKCVYELHYELDNRPDWVATPLAGLETLMRETDAG